MATKVGMHAPYLYMVHRGIVTNTSCRPRLQYYASIHVRNVVSTLLQNSSADRSQGPAAINSLPYAFLLCIPHIL